jgi:hypothetical protein
MIFNFSLEYAIMKATSWEVFKWNEAYTHISL